MGRPQVLLPAASSSSLSRLTTSGMLGRASGSCAQHSLHIGRRDKCQTLRGAAAAGAVTPETEEVVQHTPPDELAVGVQAGECGGIRPRQLLPGRQLQALAASDLQANLLTGRGRRDESGGCTPA